MNIKTLIPAIAIVLGSASAAMAQPTFSASGRVTVNTGSVVVRDHRTYEPQIVRFNQSRRQRPEWPSYPQPSYPQHSSHDTIGAGWTLIDFGTGLSRRDGAVFEIGEWLGSIRLESMRGNTSAYDAEIIYADGRVVNLTGMRGNYFANLAPGVVSRIIVRGARPGRWPQLFVSASNH